MTSATERMRRLRARQRRGDVVAPVEVSPAVVETLIDLAWLPENASEDRKAIGLAVSEMLAELASAQQQKQ